MSDGARAMLRSADLPDAAMVKAFSDMVFGYVEGPVPVRILPENGRDVGASPWTETCPADSSLGKGLFAFALKAASAGRALYVVPATLLTPGKATAGNIAETAIVIIDLDTGDIPAKRRFLERHLGAASLVVESGGVTVEGFRKLHMYWRLTEPAKGDDLEIVRRVREAIAVKGGGDPSLGRLHQPIRVAGSLHQKGMPPVLARIVQNNGRDYDLSTLAEAVDAMPAAFAENGPSSRDPANSVRPSILALKQTPIRAKGEDGVTRYEALSRVMGHWIRLARVGAISIEEAREAVRDHNAALIRPPWETERLEREFEALRKRDALNNQGDKSHRSLTAGGMVSEHDLAAMFIERHGDEWRHVAAARIWRRWSGSRWLDDTVRNVFHKIREICREAADGANAPSDRKRLGSWKVIQSVERIAAADPQVAATSDVFDADPHRLNTPGGVIDLRTGEIAPCDPADMMTKMAGVAPGGPCSRWLEFLDEVTAGDRAMQAYLQRVAGYCLTGSTEEQVFFFLHGHGANGKSIFLNTIAAAMGDYAKTSPFETFVQSTSPGHPTELAGLAGARLIAVTETERNRVWAESRIKAVTGGDAISTRFMRGDFFEYRPSFKLVIAGNHLPRLTSFGEAMKRRLHLVPFTVAFPEEERDGKLGERLRAEHGGILAWMIDGCAKWRSIGLKPPCAVDHAAQSYFEEEDVIGQWIAERCDLGADLSDTAANLFKDWSGYAEECRHPSGSQRALALELDVRGFNKVRGAGGVRVWRGLALRRRGGARQ